MRYAIFSDVHANLRAWELALADISSQDVDVLICLGDAVGYGPRPEEVLRGIRAATDNFVMGNHDAAAAGLMDYSVFNDQARHSIDWTTRALSDESREFLGAVPLAIDAGDILFVHAEITEPGRFAYIDDPQSALENFADSTHFVTFVGHTHHPKIYQLGEDGSLSELPDENQQLDPSNRYIVNVGSVGEPRNPEDLRGVYVVYDSDTRKVDYRRVAFDIAAYRSDLESTTLEVKPFFLQCYDHQDGGIEASPPPSAALALAMEAPAVATPLISQQSGPVKLHIRSEPLDFGHPADFGEEMEEEARSGRGRTVTLITLIGAFAIALGIWAVIQFREDPTPSGALTKTDTTTIVEDNTDETDPGNEVAVVPNDVPETNPDPVSIPDPDPVTPEENTVEISKPPGTKPDAVGSTDPKKSAPTPAREATVAWWRMESDSVGAELIDKNGKHTLPAEIPGTPIGGLAPPVIPANGAGNQAALGLGVWTEPEPGGVFELNPGRSFTVEGWVLTAKQLRPVFLLGTRSGDANDSQGWHIDLRPPSSEFPGGQMCFFYDNGPDIVQALSEDIQISNLKPHHFAAVWDHGASASEGEMRLFLDGGLIAATRIPHSLIPEEQVNPFRIGAATNPPKIGLDEVRFSRTALNPRNFLNVSPEIVLLVESFENPEVTGYQAKSASPGWIGSGVGFGCDRRGLIHQGDGADFTTPHGSQAFFLGYANSGLTSAQSAVREVLTAGNTYRVTFNVGAKKGKKTDYLVELVAFDPKHDDVARRDVTGKRPGVVLAKATGNVTKHDLSETGRIVFKPDPANRNLGKAIGVRLVKGGHNGEPIFDNIKLTSRTVDPVVPGKATVTSVPKQPKPGTGSVPVPGTGATASSGTDHKNQPWTPTDGETIGGVHYNVSDFTIASGTTVKVEPGTRFEVTALTVSVEGTLSAEGAGSKPGAGTPGDGITGGDNRGAGGGGYGGAGGAGNVAGGGLAWGDPSTANEVMYPRNLGSAGGTAHATKGGAGGGAIKLLASGTLTVDGKISADGVKGQGQDDGSGGGSGGSVWLECGIFSGTGSITARGGEGQIAVGKGGGGGGGRVAIHCAQNLFKGETIVEGGSGHTPGEKGSYWIDERYPLEGKIGIARTWKTRLGSSVVAKLISAEGNRIMLFTAQRKKVAVEFAKLSVDDQLYLLRPLPEAKGEKVIIEPAIVVEDSGTPSWWRMESDSVGGELVDAKGKRSLPVLAPGKKIGVLAPAKIPSNGIENTAALNIGTWGESAPSGKFGLKKNRSFTLEGWVLTARALKPIFLAGTRTGEANDGQGWHIDIRSNGRMCFFYDNGPSILQALSEKLPVTDLKPHHFAAVWDHDASPSEGEMRLYFDGEQVATSRVPRARIPAVPANPFQIGALTNPPKIGLDEVRFSYAALGPLEFLRTGAQSMNKNGKWADPANWSGGEPPSGSQTAVVDPGIVVQVEKAPSAFSGDLVLGRLATMTLKNLEAFSVIPKPPAKLILHQGAQLIVMSPNGANIKTEFGKIEMAGHATIWGGRSTSGHHTKRVFSREISGPGTLVLDGVNNNQFSLTVANSFRGGLVAKTTQKQGFHVIAKAAGSLGRGNVEILANASLVLDVADAIAPAASLTLTGGKHGGSPAKVTLNGNNTVAVLMFGRAKQAPGTWGAKGSGADNEHANFSGKGILTVTQ